MRSTAVAIAVFLFSILSGSASAVTIVNGALDGVADFNIHNSILPSGWTASMGSPDTFDPTTAFANYAWVASAGGGTFVHALASNSSQEALSQVITGLVVGTRYRLEFEQAIAHPNYTQATEGFWRVTFGAETFDSAIMTAPVLGGSAPWQLQSLDFLATSTVQTLMFHARSTSTIANSRIDIGLDSIAISTIPEPSTALLMSLGLALLGARRRP